jgi:hypothetical protein
MPTSETGVFATLGVAIVISAVAIVALAGCTHVPAKPTAAVNTTIRAKDKPAIVFDASQELNAEEFCESFEYRVGSDAYVQCVARWRRSHLLRAQSR